MTINEWGQLKKVIVGIADNAKIPKLDKSLRTVNYADIKNINSIKYGPYPKQVIDEANEDLETFCDFLKSEKIEVVRPIDNNPNYYNYCPRDSLLTYQDKSIVAPMPIKARYQEWKAYEHHLNNIINLSQEHSEDLYNLDCIGNPNILALNETEPAFDAANILKSNDTLLYLVSNSGNEKGVELLKEYFNVKIIKDVYSYMHLDSTIAFLKEGLLLLNPSRIKDKKILPEPFNKWDAIYAPDPVDIGYYEDYCNSSKWVSMNLFSINSNLVVLEEHQHDLRKELEKYNIECAMLPMRHARTLGGCFHCVTLDLIRET